jgi:hypothetical protein
MGGGQLLSSLQDQSEMSGAASDAATVAAAARAWNIGTLRVVLAYVLVGGLALSPLVLVAVPALVDYPNHLARMWILAHPHGAAAVNYLPHWQLLPTLAMDFVVPPLALIMPIELAGRVFIAATLASLLLGTAAIHRALWGRVGLWPLAASLFLYNDALYWGFLNYLFGLGAALLAFAAWIATQRWPAGRRLALFSLAAGMLFLLHLFAFGVYGLLLVSWELGDHWRQRRWSRQTVVTSAVKLAQFILPGVLWLSSLANGGPRFTAYGRPIDKMLAALAPIGFGDLALVAVPACLGLLYVGWRTGCLKLAPSMRLPLIATLIAAALMPNWLLGSWGADMRLPIALCFIVIGGTALRVPRPAGIALVLVGTAFLGLRVYAVTENWRDMDRKFTEYRAAAALLPPGARLLIVQSPMPDASYDVAGLPRALASRQPPDFRHLAALSVIDRGVFDPYLFTGWTTVQATARNLGLGQTQGLPLTPDELAAGRAPDAAVTANDVGEPPYWRDWPHKFDAVLWIDFGQARATEGLPLEPLATGSFFHLYRVKGP